ncbi:WD40 repeat domain-containing protein, partial [Kitasatospora sp. NPDC056273]|uniref:WD40 repeat domain-containing protein n=1 Tax=Kitasatospora sp. NPDC056273 TaxID=3345769 RepID=UPI0035DBD608
GHQDGPSLSGRTGQVLAVTAFTAPDGTARLATTSLRMVRIWDPATGLQDGPSLSGHTGQVLAVTAFTAPDGTARLATTSRDGTVRIWNPRTGTVHALPLPEQVHALTEHRGLLIAGTESGYLAFDISVPPHSANTDIPDPLTQTPATP